MSGKVNPMKLHRHAPAAALALLVVILGCSSPGGSVAPMPATNAQSPPPLAQDRAQDRGRDALIEADRQMKELEQLPRSTDPLVREAMTRQIVDLRMRSDRLLDDMTIDDGRVHDSAIHADVANLERTMSAAANAERQAEPFVSAP
jgi:hypothetical protein